MIKKLVYLLFVSVLVLGYLHLKLGIIPRFIMWIPELVSLAALLIVVQRVSARHAFHMNPKYIYLMMSYLLIAMVGGILNVISPNQVLIGMRVYFKAFPFFLLPAVYDFSEKNFKYHLSFIFPLLILQCPLAMYQRLFQYRGLLTGDVVTGTIERSSILSIIMICSIAVTLAFYLRKKISLRFFLITSLCFFVPTTINETKGTLILLPIALILPVFLSQRKGKAKVKSLLTAALIMVLFTAAFVPIYDHFMMARRGASIVDFFSDREKVQRYLYIGAEEDETHKIRRFDTLILAYRNLSQDKSDLLFGLGMGNVIRSYFESMQGIHTDKLQYGVQMLTVTQLFWELGLLGVIVYLIFFLFLFRDTLFLMKYDDLFGSFAFGWNTVVLIMGISLFYKNVLDFNTTNLIFWYFSGIVAAKTFKRRLILKRCAFQRFNEHYPLQSPNGLSEVYSTHPR